MGPTPALSSCPPQVWDNNAGSNFYAPVASPWPTYSGPGMPPINAMPAGRVTKEQLATGDALQIESWSHRTEVAVGATQGGAKERWKCTEQLATGDALQLGIEVTETEWLSEPNMGVQTRSGSVQSSWPGRKKRKEGDSLKAGRLNERAGDSHRCAAQ